MNDEYMLKWLREAFPNRLPVKEPSMFELGILVGQQQVVEQLKIKLKLEENRDVIDK